MHFARPRVKATRKKKLLLASLTNGARTLLGAPGHTTIGARFIPTGLFGGPRELHRTWFGLLGTVHVLQDQIHQHGAQKGGRPCHDVKDINSNNVRY